MAWCVLLRAGWLTTLLQWHVRDSNGHPVCLLHGDHTPVVDIRLTSAGKSFIHSRYRIRKILYPLQGIDRSGKSFIHSKVSIVSGKYFILSKVSYLKNPLSTPRYRIRKILCQLQYIVSGKSSTLSKISYQENPFIISGKSFILSKVSYPESSIHSKVSYPENPLSSPRYHLENPLTTPRYCMRKILYPLQGIVSGKSVILCKVSH